MDKKKEEIPYQILNIFVRVQFIFAYIVGGSFPIFPLLIPAHPLIFSIHTAP